MTVAQTTVAHTTVAHTIAARRRLVDLAARQYGLFTRAQARDCGYSGYQVRRRVKVGEWQSVLGPVLGYAGVVVSESLRDRAAQLALPSSVLTGPSAARRHGIAIPDSGTFVAVAPNYHPRLVGVRLIRDPVDDDEIEYVDGLLIADRARTVIDCLRFLTEEVAVEILDRALHLGWITPEELAARAHLLTGKRGAGRIAQMSRLAGSGARSAAERRAVALLRGARIAGWRANVELHDSAGLIGVGDLVFATDRIVAEIDGWAHHVTPAQFARDRHRQNRLVAAGWRVLRFTWHDLVERPAYVVATVQQMIATSGTNPQFHPPATAVPHRERRSSRGAAVRGRSAGEGP